MTVHILSKKHGVPADELLLSAASKLERRKQRKHEILILTCYVELNLIEEFVNQIAKEIRITDVYLAFNYAEIYKNGPTETEKLLSMIEKKFENKGMNFKWSALASSNLVHSKGYGLFQKVNDQIVDGTLLVTSANFTNAGFKGINVELGYISRRIKDLRKFEESYDFLCDKLDSDIDSAIFKQETYLLKYAILSSGVFLHKWSGNLNQLVGIRYNLTPSANERGSIAPELAEVGFEAGDSFTRQILDIGDLPKKEVPRSFITQFTIETFWGRWCPAQAWNNLSANFSDGQRFIDKFKRNTELDRLKRICVEALGVQDALISA